MTLALTFSFNQQGCWGWESWINLAKVSRDGNHGLISKVTSLMLYRQRFSSLFSEVDDCFQFGTGKKLRIAYELHSSSGFASLLWNHELVTLPLWPSYSSREKQDEQICACKDLCKIQWKSVCKNCKVRTYLAAQWWRLCLPVQETWVSSLTWEGPTRYRATRRVRHSYWACALEPGSSSRWARSP